MSPEGKRKAILLFCTVAFTLGIIRTCGSTRASKLNDGSSNKTEMEGEDSGKGLLALGRNFQTKYRSYGVIKVDGLRGNSLVPPAFLENITYSEKLKPQDNSSQINERAEPSRFANESRQSRTDDSVSRGDTQPKSDTNKLNRDGENSLNLSRNSKPSNDIGAIKSQMEPLNNDSGYQSDASERAALMGILPFSIDGGGLPNMYSPHAAKSKPFVLCGKESMILMANKSEYEYLKVHGVSDSPLYLSELPSSCEHTFKMTSHNLVLKTPYDGCFIIKKGDKYIMPLLWWESPVSISCPATATPATLPSPPPPPPPPPLPPFHHFHPPVICTPFGMHLNLEGGLNAVKRLKVKLRGKKVPFLASQCGFHVIGSPGQPIIHVPYKACGMKMKDGMHVFSLFSGKTEKIFACHLSLISSHPFSLSDAHGYSYHSPPAAPHVSPLKVPIYPATSPAYNYEHGSYAHPQEVQPLKPPRPAPTGGSSLPQFPPPFDSGLHMHQTPLPVCTHLGPVPCISPFPFHQRHDTLSPPHLHQPHDPLSPPHSHDPLSLLPYLPRPPLSPPLPHLPHGPHSPSLPHLPPPPLSPPSAHLPPPPLSPPLAHLPYTPLALPLPHPPHDPHSPPLPRLRHPPQSPPFAHLHYAPHSPPPAHRPPPPLSPPLPHLPYDPHSPLPHLPYDPHSPLPHLPYDPHSPLPHLPYDPHSPLPHLPYDPHSPLPHRPPPPLSPPHAHLPPPPLSPPLPHLPHAPLSPPLAHLPYDPHSPLPHLPHPPLSPPLPHLPHDPLSVLPHHPHHAQVPFPLPHHPHVTAPQSSFLSFPTSSTLSSPFLNCTASRMRALLFSAVPGTIEARGQDNKWRPITSVPGCSFKLETMGFKGVIVSSPLHPCHAFILSRSMITLPIKFIDADLGRPRILELQCPYFSSTYTSPTTRPGQTPHLRVFCSEDSMRVELPPGPEYALRVHGTETGHSVPHRQCAYSMTKGENGRNVVVVPFTSCHVSVQGNERKVFVKFRTLGGQEGEVPLLCRISPPIKKQGCEISNDVRLPCGRGRVSPAECRSLGCCYCTYTSTCYYPLDECTPDRHMVFTVPASLTEPPLSTASLFTPGKNTCFPQKVTPNFALFKIPLDGCGVHNYEVGHTKIYMVEILNTLSAISLNYGTITRDSPVRLIVECRYSPNALVSVAYLVKTPSLGPSIQAQGVFGVQLRIAKYENYTDYYPQYHRPLSRLLQQPVYLEVRLLNPPDSNVVLLVHYCVAYPRSAWAAWVLNYDGCPNQLDVTSNLTTSAPAPLSQTRRFTIRTFQFLSTDLSYVDEEIYFMCSTEVCSPSEGPCVEGCISFPSS